MFFCIKCVAGLILASAVMWKGGKPRYLVTVMEFKVCSLLIT